MKTQKNSLSRRIKIIQGQLEGIYKMIQGEEDCIKILTQLKAAKNSFHTLTGEIVKEALIKCNNNTKDRNELIQAFSKF